MGNRVQKVASIRSSFKGSAEIGAMGGLSGTVQHGAPWMTAWSGGRG